MSLVTNMEEYNRGRKHLTFTDYLLIRSVSALLKKGLTLTFTDYKIYEIPVKLFSLNGYRVIVAKSDVCYLFINYNKYCFTFNSFGFLII